MKSKKQVNKKELYESIMQAVSKSVKQKLNEADIVNLYTGENESRTYKKQINLSYDKCDINGLINIIIIMLFERKEYKLTVFDDLIIIADSDQQLDIIKLDLNAFKSSFSLVRDTADDVLILLDEFGKPITGEISLGEWKEIADAVYNFLY